MLGRQALQNDADYRKEWSDLAQAGVADSRVLQTGLQYFPVETRKSYLKFCEGLIQKAQLQEAHDWLTQGLSLYVNDSDYQQLWLKLGEAAISTGNLGLAEKVAKTAYEQFSPSKQPGILLGKVYLLTQQFGKAEFFFDALEDVVAQDGLLMHRLGDAFWERKNNPKAIQAHEQAISLYRESQPELAAQLSFRLGDHYLSKKKYWVLSDADLPNAVRCFERAYHLHPTEEAYKTKCLSTLQQALKTGASWTNIFTGLSEEHLTEFYELASQLAVKVPGDHVNQVIAAHEKKQEHRAAVEFYEKMQALWPAEMFKIESISFFKVGEALHGEGEDAQANAYYEKGLKRGSMPKAFLPGYHGVQLELALEEVNLADREKKLEALRGTVTADEKIVLQNTLEALVDVRTALASEHEKKCLLPEPLERSPKFQHKVAHKADAQQAIAWLEKALEIAPKDAKLHFQVAELYAFFEMDESKACEHYRLAFMHDQKNPFYCWMLARAYNNPGQEPDSKRTYERLKKLTEGDVNWVNDTQYFMEYRFVEESAVPEKLRINPHST